MARGAVAVKAGRHCHHYGIGGIMMLVIPGLVIHVAHLLAATFRSNLDQPQSPHLAS